MVCWLLLNLHQCFQVHAPPAADTASAAKDDRTVGRPAKQNVRRQVFPDHPVARAERRAEYMLLLFVCQINPELSAIFDLVAQDLLVSDILGVVEVRGPFFPRFQGSGRSLEGSGPCHRATPRRRVLLAPRPISGPKSSAPRCWRDDYRSVLLSAGQPPVAPMPSPSAHLPAIWPGETSGYE